MLTCNVVGAAEKHAAETAHGGSHDNEDWGGIPVVIFVGDDYQLPPPTNKEKGAFDLLDSRTSFSQRSFGSGSFGCQVLWDVSTTCVELRSTKRQNKSQPVFKRDSALYFTGQNMNRYRVVNLRLQKDEKTPYKKVRLRDAWVSHLDNNTVDLSWSEKEKRSILEWAAEFRMSLEELEFALSQRSWRKNMIK